jgi:hypothetical protein
MRKKHVCHSVRIALACLIGGMGVISSPGAAAGGGDPPSRVLVEGEELTYNVRYAFFDLGQVRIRTGGKTRLGSSVTFASKALIDSYPKLPFVTLHAVFESAIDSAVFSQKFSGKIREDDRWDFSRYHFDYGNNRVFIELGRNDTVISQRETLSVDDKKYQDGLSLFFFARDRLFSHTKMNIPTLVKEKKVNTFIDFQNDRAGVEIDAVDYPVDVVKFEGIAEFEGIFGLTGDFTGWFSNDEARVPILAKMKVILGSVTIELMEWKRSGWTPPRAQN